MDDLVPVASSGKLLCAHSATPQELWVLLIEKLGFERPNPFGREGPSRVGNEPDIWGFLKRNHRRWVVGVIPFLIPC